MISTALFTALALSTFLIVVSITNAHPLSTTTVVRKHDVDTFPCRVDESIRMCLDPPLDVDDKDDWCPHRQCQPSFVRAEGCHKDENLRSTHKCKEVKVERRIWQCIPGRLEKMTKLRGNPKTYITCACRMKRVERTILEYVAYERFVCPQDKKNNENKP